MPLYYHRTESYKWIYGSIRKDLEPDERGVWADLMALATLTKPEERRGYIERSKGIPYERETLLVILNITGELFNRTIKKCAAEGRLQILTDGAMFLTNWQTYNSVNDYETKRAIKALSKRKERHTKSLLEADVEALTSRVNILAAKQPMNRYALTPEGKMIDLRTGEIVEPEIERRA